MTINLLKFGFSESGEEELQNVVGAGISLTYVNGQMFLDNLSPLSLFCQSWTGTENYNKIANANHHRATIMEIKNSLVGICVFDLSIFAQDLEV